jgi:ADP-heptose:LPS heptosyltransferase
MTILVLHQGAIGDFLLTLSVVQAVRAWAQADRVVAVASASSARLAAGHSAIDRCHSPEDVGLHTLFRETGPVDDRLTGLLSGADIVLSFLGDASGPVHQRIRRAATGRVVSVDPRPLPETLTGRRHITSQWQAAIRRAGLDIGDPQPPVLHVDFESASSRRTASHLRIILHPGSGGRDKCWPVDRFVALVNSLNDVEVTWMLGPAERENEALVRVVRERARAGHERLLIDCDLAEAARSIARADLYVGNDSGMTHMAAAVSAPTIAVFGPTDPRVWCPLGEHVTTIGPSRPGDSITAIPTDRLRTAVLSASLKSAHAGLQVHRGQKHA